MRPKTNFSTPPLDPLSLSDCALRTQCVRLSVTQISVMARVTSKVGDVKEHIKKINRSVEDLDARLDRLEKQRREPIRLALLVGSSTTASRGRAGPSSGGAPSTGREALCGQLRHAAGDSGRAGQPYQAHAKRQCPQSDHASAILA